MFWKYEAPDTTQMRMDKDSVSFYFPELEQIEIYDIADNQGASYFFFAFEASAQELKDSFDIVVEKAAEEDLERARLVPTAEPVAAQLLSITLWLRKSDYLPQRILIHEASGDSTEIELSKIRINEPIDDKEMQFDAPEGTEIIKADSYGF